jgi:hypothetical protein
MFVSNYPFGYPTFEDHKTMSSHKDSFVMKSGAFEIGNEGNDNLTDDVEEGGDPFMNTGKKTYSNNHAEGFLESGLLKTFGKAANIRISGAVLEKAHRPGILSYFTVYHAFFLFALSLNVVFTVLTTFNYLPAWRPIPTFMDKGACGLTNISIALLARTELFLQFFYWSLTELGKRTASHTVRYYLAQIQYHAPGGIHAGCGFSAMIWITSYIYSEWFSDFNGPGLTSDIFGLLTTITGIMLSSLLVMIVFFALPPIRRRHHNLFEWTHRYFG